MTQAQGTVMRTAPHTDFTRFIVLSGPRAGSHMLASMLNSHPDIVCFREVLNGTLASIQYGVEGYDGSDEADLALRRADPVLFLQRRIFGAKASGVMAVGFKYHYTHVLSFKGVQPYLREDGELRVLHLRRRNLLRSFVSLKLAEETGVWLKEGAAYAESSLRKTLRSRVPVIASLRRVFGAGKDAPRRPGRITIDVNELSEFVTKTAMSGEHFDRRFGHHPLLKVCYEDIVQEQEPVLEDVQRFLGVPPRGLSERTTQQHPAPIEELVTNYDEVRRAFEESAHIGLDA